MHITIRFLDGRRVEGIVLAVSAEKMRLSLPDCDDAMELTLARGMWMTEKREFVELEALATGSDLSSLFGEIGPRAYAAARVVS